MKIALCSSSTPFLPGGVRNSVEWLELMLLELGHQVERVCLPHVDVPDLLFDQMAAYRWIDLDAADRVICFRAPAHFISHPQKIVWLLHHVRTSHDPWGSSDPGFAGDARHAGIRAALRDADTRALAEAEAVYTGSRIVSGRLEAVNGVASTVLYPPLFKPDRFHFGDLGDEIVGICRMEPRGRQHLLVEAMSRTRTPVKLRLLGPAMDPSYVGELTEQIRKGGLQQRVQLQCGWIGDEARIELLAKCLALAYLPSDADSYGFPSLEASHSCKPVLTATDAHGVLELVEHGRNGLVCAPTAESLAGAMDRLFLDRTAARRMGQAARERVAALGIGWPAVLGKLLA
jgi:glycosyltransferase involved in cell wall biosynthesis